MGILNLTPDSFYDGGIYKDMKSALKQVEKMLSDGATFLDVGAYSSRPGADHIPEIEELKRLLPVVTEIIKEFPEAVLSIDTFRAQVAQEAIHAGAALVNDISAGHLDEKMLTTVAQLKVPYIMMHMRGTPQTMKTLTDYDNLTQEVIQYFSERIKTATALGINDLIVDPGFGFAKTTEQSFMLLQQMEMLDHLNFPILAGLSRKSMIYKTLNITPDKALNGTTALHIIALQKGANILRVHDVKEAVECVELYCAYAKM